MALFGQTLHLGIPNIPIDTVNELHFVKVAYGGGFIDFAILFALGASRPKLSFTSLVALGVFMGSFAFGRIISMLVDGLPAPLFQCLVIGDITYAAQAAYRLSGNRT